VTECGLYQVVGLRDFRGHPQGTEFAARLNPLQEQRAVMRGSIVRVGSVTLKPETYTFPEGWLSPSQLPSTEARASGSLS
jgi:hypothetical protein